MDEHLEKNVDTLLTPVSIHGRERRIAFVLPVVFPDNTAIHSSLMEAIFAQMSHLLTGRIDSMKSLEDPFYHIEQTKKILKDLKDDVLQGWCFPRQPEVEARLRDSSDFHDFIGRQTGEVNKDHRRIETWRRWVNRFLNNFGSELLVIFIDDADMHPALAHDILQSLLIYLDHPRIVTILAGNLRSMQYNLLDHFLNHLQPAIKIPGRKAGTAEWRNRINHQIEEYIQKVLPRSGRHDLFTIWTDNDAVSVTDPVNNGDAVKCATKIDQCPLVFWLLKHGYDALR